MWLDIINQIFSAQVLQWFYWNILWLTCGRMIFKEITIFRGTVINYTLASALILLLSWSHSAIPSDDLAKADIGAYKFMKWWASIQKTVCNFFNGRWLVRTSFLGCADACSSFTATHSLFFILLKKHSPRMWNIIMFGEYCSQVQVLELLIAIQ